MRHASLSTAPPAREWTQTVNLAGHLVYRHVHNGRGSETAVLFEDQTLTYADLASGIGRTASWLRDVGLVAGGRVLIVLPDTPAFVFGLLGTLQVGGIAVPVNPLSAPDEVLDVARRVRPTVAIVSVDLAGLGPRLVSAGVQVVQAGDGCARRAEFEREIEARPADTAIHEAADALAYCLFSSGTTGAPKGIAHRHVDILYCIEAYSVPVLQMSSSDRVLAVPKLTFGYGLGGNLLSSLYTGGASILFAEASSRDSVLRAALRRRPTLFLGQPRLISDLLRAPLGSAFDSLRLAVSAGEVLAPALYRRWRQTLDVELLDGFGSTEVGHVFISNRAGRVREGCAGEVVDGFDVKIVDAANADVPADTVGQLWVRGPSLATEYWEDPDRTRQHFQDGWVRTGDLFRRDADGFLYACGRTDDMIKAGCGQWVAPGDIEGLLLEDDAVADCAVVGMSDADGVVRPKAYVELRPGTRPTLEIEERLKARVAERWARADYKHLGAIEFVSALPRSSTGKVQRFRLRPATLSEFSYDC